MIPRSTISRSTRALNAECFYIGALGSRKTHAKRLERMRAAGFGEAALARIHAPIGLDIGAVSPAEIAVVDHGRDHRRLAQEAVARGRTGGLKFGSVSVAEAVGAIVAHAVRRDGLVLKKGPGRHARAARRACRRRASRSSSPRGSSPAMSARTRRRDGWPSRLAGANLRSEAAFTGRVNLFAAKAGLVVVDAAAIARINGIDESITVATLAPFKPVAPGDMVATVKIIPFAVPGETLAKAHRRGGRRRCPRRPVPPFAGRRRLHACCRA